MNFTSSFWVCKYIKYLYFKLLCCIFVNTLVLCFINAVSLHSQLTGCNISCITQEKPGLPADAWVSQAERLMQCRTCGAVLMKNLNKEPVVFRLTEKNRMTSVPLSLRRRAVCCKHTWTETYQLHRQWKVMLWSA